MSESKTLFALFEDSNWDAVLNYLESDQGRQEASEGEILHYRNLYDAPVHILRLVCELNPDGLLEAKFVDGLEQYPLFIALENPRVDVEVIRTILNVNPLAAQLSANVSGFTPLHVACSKKLEQSHKIISLLCESNDEALSLRDVRNNFYPVHYAIQNKSLSIETIELLVNSYPLALRGHESRPGIAFATLLYFLCCNADRPHFCELAEILLRSYPEAAVIKFSDEPLLPEALPINRLLLYFHVGRHVEPSLMEKAFMLLAESFQKVCLIEAS